jgi:hypothetical protein
MPPIRKPDGELYRNDDDNWRWLIEDAAKSARWLGYIPFERIIDQRNSAPIIHRKARVTPQAHLKIGIDVAIPDVEDIEPLPAARGFVARQDFNFAIFGEKASLEDIVLPIAQQYEADLYLPTGEISDTLVYRIAKEANADGRPLVMFTISDCDPAGHQMPVSIARKLQAFADLFFPDLAFEVVRVALTPEQVREEDLPSTPLKATERRASRWQEAFGIAQTEIDALVTPAKRSVLQRIVRQAFDIPTAGTGAKERIDVLAVHAWIIQHAPQYAFVERAQAMPGQGASSGFKYGRAVGALEAAVTCCGIPLTIVEPSMWKKFHGLHGADKEPSRQKALMLFPAAHALLARRKDHGRAEAALIALFGAKMSAL